MSVQIVKVRSKADLKKFIKFPFTLYKNHPYWVPPLLMDEFETLDKNKNPAFEHAQSSYWLAFKDGKLAGRIAGIMLDEEVKDKNIGRFGWLDFIDDPEVSSSLIKTVETWAENNNLSGLHGPLGFSDMDPLGMLTEGFDSIDLLPTTYNYEYYPKHIEELGYSTSAEWVQYRGKADFEFKEEDYKKTELIKDRFGLKFLEGNRQKDYRPYGREIYKLYNRSFLGLYGFYPLSDKQIDYYVEKFLKFFRVEYFHVILKDEKVIGFGVGVPSFSEALQKSKGKLLPFGWYHLLKAFRSDEEIDFYMICTDPDYSYLGITRLIMFEALKSLKENGSRVFNTDPILQTNKASKGMWSSPLYPDAEVWIYKKRQCFLKKWNHESE